MTTDYVIYLSEFHGINMFLTNSSERRNLQLGGEFCGSFGATKRWLCGHHGTWRCILNQDLVFDLKKWILTALSSACHRSNLFVVLLSIRIWLAFSHAVRVASLFRRFKSRILLRLFRVFLPIWWCLLIIKNIIKKFSHWRKVRPSHRSHGWEIHKVTHSIGKWWTSRKASSCNPTAAWATFPNLGKLCLVSRELRSVNVLEWLVLTLDLAEFSFRWARFTKPLLMV